MKSIFLSLAAFLFSAGVGFSQTSKTPANSQPASKEVKKEQAPAKAPVVKPVTPTTESKKTPTKAQENAKSQQGVSNTPSKTKKDGTPDMRYKENQKLKKDGTPDMRYNENKEKAKPKPQTK